MANESTDTSTQRLNHLFAALADPTRRSVIMTLGAGPRPISYLADGHDMALPSFLKHIDKLERAGLVVSHKAGRVRTCHLHPEAMRPAQDWLQHEATRWAGAMDRLAAHLDALERKTRQ